ncbi:hypothetical protein IAT38_000159 [Cryptococcus sp. DSM 104549]
MPLSDADLAATNIDDGSFISDPYDRPVAGANTNQPPGASSYSRYGMLSGRRPAQAPSDPNVEASLITIERLRQERLNSNIVGAFYGCLYGAAFVYVMGRPWGHVVPQFTRNQSTLMFLGTFAFSSTAFASRNLQKRMIELRKEDRQRAIDRGEIPDPNSPDRLFDTSGVGDSPSGLASPEEAGWSGLERSGAEGRPGLQARQAGGQPQWYKGAVAQRPQDVQGEQDQKPMTWAERQRRANPLPADLRHEIARLKAGIPYNEFYDDPDIHRMEMERRKMDPRLKPRLGVDEKEWIRKTPYEPKPTMI